MEHIMPKILPVPPMQSMDIAVRAYVCRDNSHAPNNAPGILPKKQKPKKSRIPSEWTLVFDTETTTDASQALRFGTYQVRKGESLLESGVFYDAEILNAKEKLLLTEYTHEHNLALLTVEEFIENIFYGIGYKYCASIVGLNLPFDISRLAIDHCTARYSKWNPIMRGGFSFLLSKNTWNPRVQIKHVSSRDSFIQFTSPHGQRDTRGDRKKKRREPVRRGFFLDIKTLAAALTSQSHSLASLAKTLGVESQKHDTDQHGLTLSKDYIEYAIQDTQTTWECFVRLKEIYDLHGLHMTEPHQIHSEASLGKAYLREMGIQPWRKMQPEFPPNIIGKIMSTYYGGRSEIHIRRMITQVLYCDFLSMYPTVCTLMGLWQFVTAQGMDNKDTTAQTRQFLEKVTISDLQNPETWGLISTIVRIAPNTDILPVRTKYGDEAQYTIGLNYLCSEVPLWFTLADCISSKLLTGKTPDILEAISFTPQNMQDGLKSVNIAGNSDYGVNPCEGDFFKQIIDLRTGIKKQLKAAPLAEKHIYERQQLALKILANSTSYGIFVELNVEEEKTLQSMQCYGTHDKAMSIQKNKFEAAGTFFHPLLATLITSGARLMLSITEKMACDAGLNWAFCDTDSMALAKPESMPEDEFHKRAKKVQEWFTPLNPYTEKAPLLKIEDYNYPKSGGTVLQSLYCYAISSKRYALFNQDSQGNITLRKVSAHGLGHLIAPYQSNDISNLEEVLPWQQDFWLQIIKAELEGHPNQPDFENLPNFNRPAISRYGATTPTLTKWFEAHNQGKPYSKKVRPFNFLLAMQAGKKSLPSSQMRPVSPFNKDHKKALAQCFDRLTGNSIKPRQLKTYIESLSQYHLHPETKFLNGDYTNKGVTQRRHIRVKAIQHIGKEANKWEEQYFTGYDPEAQIEYGICSDQNNKMLESIMNAIKIYGTKSMAKVSKLSERYILKVYDNKAKPSNAVIKRLYSAIEILDNLKNEEQELIQKINKNIAEQNISIRNIAREISLGPSNLAKILSGHRKNSGHLEIAHEYLKKFI